MSISVRLTESLGSSSKVLILPFDSQGFRHPVDFTLAPSVLQALSESMSIGNGVDFGDRGGKRVFGIYCGWVCDYSDTEMLWFSLQTSIAEVQRLCSISEVVVAPLLEEKRDEFEATLNRYFFIVLCNAMQIGQLTLCAKNIAWVRELLEKVRGEIKSPVNVEPSFAENRSQMAASVLSCAKCSEYAEDGVVSECCERRACLLCSQVLRQCPKCAKATRWKPSLLLREQVANLLYVCECHEYTTMAKLKEHQLSCPLSMFMCTLCSDRQTYGLDEWLKHAQLVHTDQLIFSFASQ